MWAGCFRKNKDRKNSEVIDLENNSVIYERKERSPCDIPGSGNHMKGFIGIITKNKNKMTRHRKTETFGMCYLVFFRCGFSFAKCESNSFEKINCEKCI